MVNDGHIAQRSQKLKKELKERKNAKNWIGKKVICSFAYI